MPPSSFRSRGANPVPRRRSGATKKKCPLETTVKDSPPYLHDGRLLTIADTVEFFNLVLALKLTQEEKDALVAYMLAL